MNYSRLVPLPLLITAGTLAFASSPGQELAWHPSSEVKLRREIVTKHFLTAELQSSSSGDNRNISQRRFDLESVQSLTVKDSILERKDGRPTKLRRYYVSSEFVANTESSAGRQRTKDDKIKGSASMVGKSVMFTWDPEEGVYGRYFDQIEGVEEALPGLSASLGMRQLLPEGPVQLGSTWKLEPGVLRGVFDCGGETDIELANDAGRELYRTMRLGTGLDIDQVFGESEKGTVTARWTGIEENDDGRSLALIKLEFDVVIQRDMGVRAASGVPMVEVAAGIAIDSALVTLELQGGGVVRWDMDGGHLHDLQEFKADQRVSTKLVKVVKKEDGSQLHTQVLELIMIGFLTHAVTVTEEP